MKELINKVEEWAVEKGLLPELDIKAQLNQLDEEFGEMVCEVRKGNDRNTFYIWLELGDCLVVCVILSKFLGIKGVKEFKKPSLLVCLDTANAILDIVEAKGSLTSAIKKNQKLFQESNMYLILDRLSNIAKKEGANLEQCLQVAYDKISNRKGKMVKGQFIKEQDLKNV